MVSSTCVLICFTRPSIRLGSPAPSTIVVLSLSILTRLARPKSVNFTLSSFRPTSSEMTWPPVKVAISSSIAFRLSPNPGALTAATFRVPRSLFTTNVAKASPSTSSEMMTIGFPILATCSRIGSRSFIALIFFSTMRRKASSIVASMRSALVTK